MRFRKQTARGLVWFIEPMFPGYLFARFEYDASHRLVRHGRSISGCVQFGYRFGLLPDLLIEELKARVGESETVESRTLLRPGTKCSDFPRSFPGTGGTGDSLYCRQRLGRGFNRMDGPQPAAEANAADLLTLGVAGPVRI